MSNQPIKLNPSEAATYAAALVGDIAEAVAAGDPAAAAAVISELAGVDKQAAVGAVDAATDTAGSRWVAEHFGNGRPGTTAIEREVSHG